MREMRNSQQEWLGMVPAEWEQSTIGSLYSLRNEKVSDRDYPPLSVTMKGIVPQLDTAAKTDAHDDRKLVRKGDFAINSRSDRRGSCGISDYDGSVSLINTILTPRTEMNPHYYNWLFHSSQFADEFYRWGHGIVDDLWTTRWQEMKNIVVSVPSLREQEQIAISLDGAISKVDALIANQQAQIEKLKQYKQSLITEVVTKGLDPNAPMKDSGVECIGRIPINWRTGKIHAFADFFNGDRTSRYPKPEELLSEGIPFLNSTNINGDSLDLTECKYISLEKYNTLSGAKIDINDILYCLRGSIGKCAINLTEKAGTVASSLMTIRCRESLNPHFLLYVLLSSVISPQVYLSMNGTCAANLSAESVGNFVITIPPADAMEKIVISLKASCSKLEKLIEIKQEKINKLNEYKKSLIYEYVTGKKEVV